MTKITIISSSPAEQTRLNGVREFVRNHLEKTGLKPGIINIRDLPPEDLIWANFTSEEILKANKQIKESSVIIVLTPVYKASFTGILKTFLDLQPQNGFENKTILPIAIGGTFGHLLMIDYALKPVLAALGATQLLKGVFVLDSQVKKLDTDKYELEAEAKKRLGESLDIITKKVVSNILY